MLSSIKKKDVVVLIKTRGVAEKPRIVEVIRVVKSENFIFVKGLVLKFFRDTGFDSESGPYKIIPYVESEFRVMLLAYDKSQCIHALRTFIRDIPIELDLNQFSIEQLKAFLSLSKVRAKTLQYENYLKQIGIKMVSFVKDIDKVLSDGE